MGQIQIHLPKPCHENWHTMTIEEKGRFCQACQKTVYDFTAASDRQILAHLKSNPNTCGRVLATQLDRNLDVPYQKNSIWSAASAGFLSLFVLTSNGVSAQTKQQSVHIYRAKLNRESAKQKMDEPQPAKPEVRVRISGVVIEGGLPVPTTFIQIKETATKTNSDFDGNFTIEAQQGDTIRFSFIGMKDYEMVATKTQDNLQVVMEADQIYLGGAVMYSGGISSTTFVGRLFNRVRNLFR